MSTLQPNFNASSLDFFGNPNLSIMKWGKIVTNAIGISNGSVTFKCKSQLFYTNQPLMWSQHPLAPYMLLTHRTVSFENGFAYIDCEYDGMSTGYTPVPVYELSISCGEEPIETNPNFLSIAGDASAPINGAIFTCTKQPPLSPAVATVDTPAASGTQGWYTFKAFAPVLDDGTLNTGFAGVLKYLSPDNVTWRQIVAAISGSNSMFTEVGTINTPPGPVPSFDPRNWLYMGASQVQKGNCFEISNEWKLSGKNGWNELIYPS